MLVAKYNAAAQANSLPESQVSSLGTVTPAAVAPSLPADVYIHLLEDEIYHLRWALNELIRMHYRLDELSE